MTCDQRSAGTSFEDNTGKDTEILSPFILWNNFLPVKNPTVEPGI